ncbi:MAG: hypothetical protein GY754_08740 [bacterium]|nr:hypothetical protein [bacterium]
MSELTEVLLKNKDSKVNYAVDEYVKELKREALKQILINKNKLSDQVVKIKYHASDYNIPIDYILLYEKRNPYPHEIELYIPSKLPNSVDDNDPALHSFCSRQLEKTPNGITKLLSWGDHYKLPHSLFYYELIKSLKDLPQLLQLNSIVIDDRVTTCVGGHDFDYDSEEEFLLISLSEAKEIFNNSDSLIEFLKIFYAEQKSIDFFKKNREF